MDSKLTGATDKSHCAGIPLSLQTHTSFAQTGTPPAWYRPTRLSVMSSTGGGHPRVLLRLDPLDLFTLWPCVGNPAAPFVSFFGGVRSSSDRYLLACRRAPSCPTPGERTFLWSSACARSIAWFALPEFSWASKELNVATWAAAVS